MSKERSTNAVRTEMKSRGILYRPEMILAKMEGRKSQTRRIIKESFNGCLFNGGPHPCPNEPVVFHPGEKYSNPYSPTEEYTVDWINRVEAHFHCSTLDSIAKCPYGKVGDLLYVKEAWQWEGQTSWTDAVPVGDFWYKVDEGREWKKGTGPVKWKSPLFMPREAARIIDEITGIKVERIQDISVDDALAEGMSDCVCGGFGYRESGGNTISCDVCRNASISMPEENYKSIWISINGQESWDRSDWVWVIETKNLSLTGWDNLKSK